MDPWRKKAHERCALLGAPASKSDGFSYISLSDWYEREYPKRESFKAMETLPILSECKDSYLVFVDGEFDASLSKPPEGLVALPLGSAMKSYGLFLQNRLQKQLREESDFFALLNSAYHGSGLFLYAAPGMRFLSPIQILHLSQERVLSFPKIQIAVGKGAELQLIQTSPKGDAISVIDCTLDEGARVSFYDVSLPATDAWQMHSLRAALKRDSFFKMVSVSSGAKMVRSSFKVELMEENSEAQLCGLSLLSDASESHIHGNVIHKAPFSRSEQQFRAVLREKSRSSFEGKIFVHPEALKTESYQRSQTLLLSPDAKCFARPNLEIFADDVKASHGATVSQLNKEALFYLQSRGLKFEEASSLLVKGFAGEILSRISFPSLIAKFLGS
ncbi:MAG: Fe-S cluster assembly protein SufD [Chlamydiae bacterium]|nr:Fe-S cluster assembly protein SufD [Chlamydiota bacterium]